MTGLDLSAGGTRPITRHRTLGHARALAGALRAAAEYLSRLSYDDKAGDDQRPAHGAMASETVETPLPGVRPSEQMGGGPFPRIAWVCPCANATAHDRNPNAVVAAVISRGRSALTKSVRSGEVRGIEAVQFRELGPWHAIRPGRDGEASGRTFCGRKAIAAQRMWEEWSPHLRRCRRCLLAARASESDRTGIHDQWRSPVGHRHSGETGRRSE